VRVGITGHQRLDDESAWPWVEDTIRSTCRELARPLVGISSLAAGADQLFAEVVLELGGRLEVIVPFPGYAERFSDREARAKYAHLLSNASSVQTLTAQRTDEHGYFEAGKRIALSCDLLLAVWNGKPSKGLGGTADVVKFAKSVGRRVVHLNPDARRVEELPEPLGTTVDRALG
jgi:hypothetical protein